MELTLLVLAAMLGYFLKKIDSIEKKIDSIESYLSRFPVFDDDSN